MFKDQEWFSEDFLQPFELDPLSAHWLMIVLDWNHVFFCFITNPQSRYLYF